MLHQGISASCDSTCSACAIPGDANACTACTDTTKYLILVSDDYGPCASSTVCTSYGGLTIATSTPYKCFIGGMCPVGYYTSGSTCAACDSTCKECFGSGVDSCTVCSPDKMLVLDNTYGGRCVTIASTYTGMTMYANNLLAATAISTTSCATNCASCYSSSQYQCKTCATSYLLLAENYIDAANSWGQCSKALTVSRQRYNFGFDPQNATHQYRCHWTCQSCVAENDSFACTACSSSAYLHVLSEIDGAGVGSCRPTCGSTGERALAVGSRKYCSSSGTSVFLMMVRIVPLSLH